MSAIDDRLKKIKAVAAKRRAAASMDLEIIHEAESVPAPDDDEDFDDFSDLGERNLVKAFADLARRGRIKR